MLKSADALEAAGSNGRVVATGPGAWAIEADRDVQAHRGWPATIITYRKGDSGATYWRAGARALLSRAVVRVAGVQRAPPSSGAHLVGPGHSEPVDASAPPPADFVYGRPMGAPAPPPAAARPLGGPHALGLG